MTVIKSSPSLHAFYISWLKWAEGSPISIHYDVNAGLCKSAQEYACFVGVSPALIQRELQLQFVKDKRNHTFPFGRDEYFLRFGALTQHKDPNRLTWVRARIADGADPGFKLPPLIRSSDRLYYFYISWLAWAEGRTTNIEYCDKSQGLCEALLKCFNNADNRSDLLKEMRVQFSTAGLSRYYPFGEDAFYWRKHNETQHQDPNRLEWVRTRIVDMYYEGLYE